MGDTVQDQEADIQPPRVGYIIALNVDATSRGYDLTQLCLQDEDPSVQRGTRKNDVYLTLENCDSANAIYFGFDSANVSVNQISDTNVQAAGAAPLVFDSLPSATCQAATVRPNVTRDIRINRLVDRTLILKCAASTTAVLRIGVTSKSLSGAAPLTGVP
jgi:hypothetical protein